MSGDGEMDARLVGKIDRKDFETLMQALRRSEQVLAPLMGAERGEIVAYRLTLLIATQPEIGQMTGGSVTNTVDASPDVVRSLLYILEHEERNGRQQQMPPHAGKPN